MTEAAPEEGIPDTEPDQPPSSEPDATGDDPETVVDPSSDAVPVGDEAAGREADG